MAPGTALEVPSVSSDTSSKNISFEDYHAFSELVFEWGDSYDAKDWPRLAKILAPTLKVDYSEVSGHHWPHMSARAFLAMVSHTGFVGDPLVHTQHHIGASKYVRTSDSTVTAYHQLRAAHQRYTDASKTVVEHKGHGHAMLEHYYVKVEGLWKFGGLRPTVRWNEFEFEKIFKGFRDEEEMRSVLGERVSE